MGRTANSSNTKKANNKVNAKAILRRPIVRLAILIIVIIIFISIFTGGKTPKSNGTDLVGYQKLMNVTDGVYTFVDLDGKTKKYEGYSAMNDFYYDVTSVSRINDQNYTEVGLINKNKGTVVKFGKYDNINQVITGKYYKVEKDGKYGVIDYKGKEIIPLEYDYISITTVQEATEIVFECQKDNAYSFINESGKELMNTDKEAHSISYSNKFGPEFDTVVFISVEGKKRYFNLRTTEELFTDLDEVNLSYNILRTDDKVTFYDKNLKVKEEIDTAKDYSVESRVYFKKYVLVERKNISSGTREYTYTIYDSNFNKVVEEKSKISPVQDAEGNVYFIVNDGDTVKVINENKKTTKIEGYEHTGNSINNLQYLVLSKTSDKSKYDVFTFNGKKVESDVIESTQKGFAILTTKYDSEGNASKTIMLANKKQVPVEKTEEVYANDYYLTVEDPQNNTISVVNKNGKVSIDKVTGNKVFYVEGYIGIQNGTDITIYDTNTGKATMTYSAADYLNRDETVKTIELMDGYYRMNGKKILSK